MDPGRALGAQVADDFTRMEVDAPGAEQRAELRAAIGCHGRERVVGAGDPFGEAAAATIERWSFLTRTRQTGRGFGRGT